MYLLPRADDADGRTTHGHSNDNDNDGPSSPTPTNDNDRRPSPPTPTRVLNFIVPARVTQCVPAQLSWTGNVGPISINVVPILGEEILVETIVSKFIQSGASVSWPVDVPSGANYTLTFLDVVDAGSVSGTTFVEPNPQNPGQTCLPDVTPNTLTLVESPLPASSSSTATALAYGSVNRDSPTSSTLIPALVGGILGGLVVMVIALTAVFHIRRRRRRRQHPEVTVIEEPLPPSAPPAHTVDTVIEQLLPPSPPLVRAADSKRREDFFPETETVLTGSDTITSPAQVPESRLAEENARLREIVARLEGGREHDAESLPPYDSDSRSQGSS